MNDFTNKKQWLLSVLSLLFFFIAMLMVLRVDYGLLISSIFIISLLSMLYAWNEDAKIVRNKKGDVT